MKIRIVNIIMACILLILLFATKTQCQVLPTPTAGFQTDNQVNLGMRFRPKQDLNMTGIMYYRGTAPGTVVGNLWTSTGTLLATVTIPGTGQGWKVGNIPSVKLLSGVEYVVSINTTSYYATPFFFPRSFPLYDAINSAYRYGGVFFPTLNYQSANYSVEPVVSAIPTIRDTVVVRDTIYITPVRDTIYIKDTVFGLCPDTTWVMADGYDTVGGRFPDYKPYGVFEFTMPLNNKVRFVRRIEAVWRREEFINGQWVEK